MRIVQVYGVREVRVGVYTQRDCRGVVVKRRMEREVEQEAGHDLQVGLDPGEGLEEGGRSGS